MEGRKEGRKEKEVIEVRMEGRKDVMEGRKERKEGRD